MNCSIYAIIWAISDTGTPYIWDVLEFSTGTGIFYHFRQDSGDQDGCRSALFRQNSHILLEFCLISNLFHIKSLFKGHFHDLISAVIPKWYHMSI